MTYTTIRVRKDQWHRLSAIKLVNGYKEMSDALDLLFKEFNKKKRKRKGGFEMLGF